MTQELTIIKLNKEENSTRISHYVRSNYELIQLYKLLLLVTYKVIEIIHIQPQNTFIYLHNPGDMGKETFIHFHRDVKVLVWNFPRVELRNLLVFIFHCLHDTLAGSFR